MLQIPCQSVKSTTIILCLNSCSSLTLINKYFRRSGNLIRIYLLNVRRCYLFIRQNCLAAIIRENVKKPVCEIVPLPKRVPMEIEDGAGIQKRHLVKIFCSDESDGTIKRRKSALKTCRDRTSFPWTCLMIPTGVCAAAR